MNATSRVGGSFGTRLPETFNEEVISIIEARVIEDEIATDNGVRTEVATNMTSTSDGIGTFPTPILETLAAGPKSPRETGETEGGGNKAGSRDDDTNNVETSSGRRRDPSTQVPETLAVAPERQHRTGEMGGGREEMWPEGSIHGGKDMADEEGRSHGSVRWRGRMWRGRKSRQTGRRSGRYTGLSGRRTKRELIDQARLER